MTTTYKEITNAMDEVLIERVRNGVITWIPVNEANSDYQEYLETLKPKADEAKTK
jgi:hypothetical protein